MIGWFKKHGARLATVAVTVASVVATKVIPATAVIALGPVSVPVAGLVGGALALAAAVGIEKSPTLTKVFEAITVKRR